MKKRKFSLLLNIATICLCVCAIAIGVYSAKTASLSINGSIGFDAHNIDFDYDVTIKGHENSTDGKPYTTEQPITDDSKTNTAFNFGSINFSDLGTSGNPETIYIKVEVTNKSDYPIAVKVDLANCTSGNSSITIGASQNTSAVILADKNATDDTKKGSVIFELNLQKNASGDYDDINPATDVSLKVGLAKTELTDGTKVRADVAIKEFNDNYKKEVRSSLLSGVTDTSILSYAERYPYYIEMGGVTGQEKVKWLIVGTMGDSGLVALSDNDRAALSEGLMLNTTYSMLSEKILYTESTSNYGISFQNKYNRSTTKCTKTGYTDINATDYAASNIRQYLLGDEVNRSSQQVTSGEDGYTYTGCDADGAKVNLYTTYNLTTDPVFNKIKGRSLSSLYNESTTLPSAFEGTTEDKLWLLSETEIGTLFGNDKSGDYYYSAQAYTYTTTTTGYWWLRSPSSNKLGVYAVYDDGFLVDFGVDNYRHGARVAFQI